MRISRGVKRQSMRPFKLALAAIVILGVVSAVYALSTGTLSFGGGSSANVAQALQSESDSQPNTAAQSESNFLASLPEQQLQEDDATGYLKIGTLDTQLKALSIDGIKERERNVPFIPAPLETLPTRKEVLVQLSLFWKGIVSDLYPATQWSSPPSNSEVRHYWEMTRNPAVITGIEQQFSQIQNACSLSESRFFINDMALKLSYISWADGMVGLQSAASCGNAGGGTEKTAQTKAIFAYGMFEGGDKNQLYLVEYRVGEFRKQ